jgi:putative ABC transport system substrate-binding protein
VRRDFVNFLGGAAATWPLAARAQKPSGRVYRVGYLNVASRGNYSINISVFEDGLRSLGYRVGENVIIEYRFADGKLERLPALAADLVKLGVDVIVTGSTPNVVAAMKATTTIPIVMTNVSDPVGTGLVASLARPGGNVTGLTGDSGNEIWGKRLELLKETLPNPLTCRHFVESGRCVRSGPDDIDGGGRPSARIEACPGRSTRAGCT